MQENLKHAFTGTNLDQGHHRLQDGADGELDESAVALLDTACTSCLHSKQWREAYSRWLPPGFVCAQTPTRKTFHFANGQSTPDKLVVWQVPIFVGNVPGQVYSAEVTTGNTPLLLLIPAMSGLDMVLHMKARTAAVQAVDLEVPMLVTWTKHLAIRVAPELGKEWAKEPAGDKPPEGSSHPRVVSEAEDILVYFLEEARLPLLSQVSAPHVPPEEAFTTTSAAPDLRARGVKGTDPKGTLSERRVRELQRSAAKQATLDKRARGALRRSFSMAEQWCTNGFRNTVVFEPFGGSFGVTRLAFEELNWTCSQPLDLQDGYDLLSKSGEKLVNNVLDQHRPYLVIIAFDCRIWSALTNMSPWKDWAALRRGLGKRTLQLVLRICRRQRRAGRYYLLENPAASVAWVFDKILAELLEKEDGKFACGDQCRYGLRDSTSGKPIRKRTGWLTNCEPLLNQLGKQCRCPPGAHEVLLENNASGPRAAQAAAYPKELCRNICQGVVESMCLDYAIAMSYGGSAAGEGVYAMDDDDMLEDGEDINDSAGEEDFEEPLEDEWRFGGEGQLIRVHRVPRRKLFVPLSSTAPPCNFADILGTRRTRMRLQDGTRRNLEDDWHTETWSRRTRAMDMLWTGETEFLLRNSGGAWEEEAPTAEAGPHEREAPPMSSAAPYDSAVYEEDAAEYEPSPVGLDQEGRLVEPFEEAPAAEGPHEREAPLDRKILQRGRPRTRQLQRGFWIALESDETLELLNGTLDYIQQEGGPDWNKINLDTDLGKAWIASEAGNADVSLILCSSKARRMKKPQPHAGPHEVPLRKSLLLLNDGTGLSTEWESWYSMSPSSQVRPLVARGRKLYLVLFGRQVGDGGEPGDGDPWHGREQVRERQWQALPRELKLAIKRVHVNLGHADSKSMLRAMRLARASEVALKACRLFRCPECPRGLEKHARPARLPMTDEFNVQIGLDVFSERDSAGQEWSWLNILCQGTTFQVTALLGDTISNPSSIVVMEALASHWLNWAGYPERGVATDRAKYFIADVADDFAEHGCIFETASRASPWQIGQVERHGGLWK